MNYELHYENLITKYGKQQRPRDGFIYERHHVLPKALGGSNSKYNLMYLTGRQHFLAHWLLYKIFKTSEMAMAFFFMRANKSNYLLNENQLKASSRAMQSRGLISKAVITPLGEFSSYREAAAAHNIPDSTFQDIIRRGTEGFFDLGSARKIVARSKGTHGMARRIKTPLGYFPYVGAASKAHGISNKTISRRCLENPDEYYYLDPPKQSMMNHSNKISENAKKTYTPFGIYNSIAEAAEALGISRCTLRYKIKSKNITDYYTE